MESSNRVQMAHTREEETETFSEGISAMESRIKIMENEVEIEIAREKLVTSELHGKLLKLDQIISDASEKAKENLQSLLVKQLIEIHKAETLMKVNEQNVLHFDRLIREAYEKRLLSTPIDSTQEREIKNNSKELGRATIDRSLSPIKFEPSISDDVEEQDKGGSTDDRKTDNGLEKEPNEEDIADSESFQQREILKTASEEASPSPQRLRDFIESPVLVVPSDEGNSAGNTRVPDKKFEPEFAVWSQIMAQVKTPPNRNNLGAILSEQLGGGMVDTSRRDQEPTFKKPKLDLYGVQNLNNNAELSSKEPPQPVRRSTFKLKTPSSIRKISN